MLIAVAGSGRPRPNDDFEDGRACARGMAATLVSTARTAVICHKPSLSVIFHDGRAGKDASRLKFMAEKTVEGSPLDNEGRAKMLGQRIRQIEQVSTMLRSQSCFRRSVNEYFGDSAASNRKPFSERLLDWVFGAKPVKASHAACCDYCDAKAITKRGRLAYVAWVIGKGARDHRDASRYFIRTR